MSIVALPLKDNTPLIVDSDAMLASTIAFQPLQSIGGRNTKVGQCDSSVQHAKFSEGNLLDITWELGGPKPSENLLGLFALE